MNSIYALERIPGFGADLFSDILVDISVLFNLLVCYVSVLTVSNKVECFSYRGCN